MKLRFNGMMEKKRKGCSVCGGKTLSNGMTLTRTFILPSGITKTFRAGKCVEVKDIDAEFLLEYRTLKDGKEINAFEVCDG